MEEQVLSLCPQKNRDMVRKSLAHGNYKVSFVSALSEVSSALAELKPRIFVHDWGATEASQARQFHLKFCRSEQAASIARVILVAEISPSILAFANDALIDKVYTYGVASINLGNDLGMLTTSQDTNELSKFLRDAKAEGIRYSQADVDARIEEIYKKFPHDNKVKLEYGNLNYRQMRIKEAHTLAYDLISRDPNNMRALNLKAKCLMKSGEWEKAIEALGEANVLSPSNPDRLIMLGDAFYGKGDLDKALDCYKEASEADPEDDATAKKSMGKIHLEQGRLEDALDMFQGSASEEEAAGFFNNSAVYAVRCGKFEEALRLYKTALKALKTNKLKPLIYFNIALSHHRLDQDDEAIECLKKSLHFDENYEKAKTKMDEIWKIQNQKKKKAAQG